VVASWVEAEWRLFDGMKRSGKKKGNIIPILCVDMRLEDFPMALGRYQAVSLNSPDWKNTLLIYF
jgi:hypothetical protein